MGEKGFRVGVVGLVHNHVWSILRALRESGLGEVVAITEENPPLRERARQELGLEKIYNNYHDMLESEQLDVIFAYTENNRHADVTEAGMAAGLPVMVEKPMAATLAQAERMVEAAQKSGIPLMVNWPIAWSPVTQRAYELIRQGAIGQIYEIRNRSGHGGPQQKPADYSIFDWHWMTDREKNGAGAYMDFCCYGAAMCRWILGQPRRVFANTGRFIKDWLTVEDNGLLVMMYDHAIGVAEGSWTQIGRMPGGLSFHGSEGTLVISGNDLLLYNRENMSGISMDTSPPPVGMRSAPEYFLTQLQNNKPIEGLCSPQIGRDAQEILQAGLQSAESGQALSLPLHGG